MTTYTPIFSALEHNAVTKPEQRVYSFANEQGDIEQSLNWQQLKAKVDTLAGYLRTHHQLNAGERVLLVYPPSIDFVVAFASCMRAGLIPVPVYPPNLARADHGMNVFNKVAADCAAQLVLTNQTYATTRARKQAGGSDLTSAQLIWDTSDHLADGSWDAVHGPTPAPEDVALIQYTSGSTSMPKGVVITHGNLSHQLEFTRKTLRTDEHSEAVFWVPQYHDMGLIGGILNALGGNTRLTLFSPLAFIKRPALWFELMHRLRATHTAAPNFAFELAVRKTTPAQRAQWDLSSLKMVMSAAEPVRASTSKLFLETFAASGLNRAAYVPAYGLAEHTVGVTSNGGVIRAFDKTLLETRRIVRCCNANNTDAIELVSSGNWPDDIQVRIVDPETRIECAEDRAGEVWVNSPSKAAGYWQLDEQTRHSFQATIENGDNTEYLRTGDVGFIQDGQLYICGRIKDLLILAGRNVYPQDIEDSIQTADDAIRPDCMAAFAVDVESAGKVDEKLVVLVEIRQRRCSDDTLQAIAQTLQTLILEQHQLPCHAIVLAPIGSVLKTTSGKVRRQACRQLWVDGTLQEKALYILQAGASSHTAQQHKKSAHTSADCIANNPREAMMQAIAARLLNLPDSSAINIEQPLTQQGMGSLIAVEFCQEYESLSGEELSITQFFNSPAIRALCHALDNQHAEQETLNDLYEQQPCKTITELHALRHYLLHNRYPTSGFRIGSWSVRPARNTDVAAIHQLDQQEYGWLGEDATDDADFIAHQVATLNSTGTPWFWLLEKHNAQHTVDIIGWYIMQPTHKSPSSITSWADATDHGRLTNTFAADGQQLYLVAGGISRAFTKQAHRLMVLNALSLMRHHNMTQVFACLAMPGFAETHAVEAIAPEDYIQLEHSNGMPRDAFLAFFRELWAGDHHPLRLLRNGYPPDQRSGGHGVCSCVEVADHRNAIEAVFDKLVQQRHELFGDNAQPRAVETAVTA